MKEAKKKYAVLTLAGACAALAGLITAAAGYRRNNDGKITEEDFLVFTGFFLTIIGMLLLVSGLMRLLSRKPPVKYSSAERTRRLAFSALFMALAYIGFQYFRFDLTVAGEKTAFHLGNTFVVLAALLLGGTWGGIAGAAGLTIADFSSGYVTSAPKTLFLKLCIGLIVGFVAHTICHLSRAHGAKKILHITIAASVCGLAFNIVADPLVGYFYKKYLFGLPQDIASTLAKLSSLTTGINAALSALLSVVLYITLRPALEKSDLFFRLEKEPYPCHAPENKPQKGD